MHSPSAAQELPAVFFAEHWGCFIGYLHSVLRKCVSSQMLHLAAAGVTGTYQSSFLAAELPLKTASHAEHLFAPPSAQVVHTHLASKK